MKFKPFGIALVCISVIGGYVYYRQPNVDTSPAASVSRQAAQRVLIEILVHGRYQTELPGQMVVLESNAVHMIKSFNLGDRQPPPAPPSRRGDWLSTSIILLVFVGVFISAIIMGHIKSLEGDESLIDDQEFETLNEEKMRTEALSPNRYPDSTSDAENLAANGLYSEAVHQLLLQAVSALRSIRPISRDLTAREIYELSALDEPYQSSLYELLIAAELAHFGERSLSLETFEQNLAACRRLLKHLKTLA